jgi:hypothetical protein
VEVIQKGSYWSYREVVSLNTIRVHLRNLREPAFFPQIAQIAADLRRKRQDRGVDFRPEGSHNARRIILTEGRFLLNDA